MKRVRSKALDRAIRIADNWTTPFKEFEKIIDKYFPDERRIESEIKRLYMRHKGERDWEMAYKKWLEGGEA